MPVPLLAPYSFVVQGPHGLHTTVPDATELRTLLSTHLSTHFPHCDPGELQCLPGGHLLLQGERREQRYLIEVRRAPPNLRLTH